jgi:hypothetical protein
MSARRDRRSTRYVTLGAVMPLALLGLWVGTPVNHLAAAAPPALRAVINGSVGSDVHFMGAVRRTGRTRWCGNLEVRLRVTDGASAAVEEIYDSGRECGTIRQESVVMLTVACPTALGVGGVLRGRPTLRVRYTDGRVRAVSTRRIRDRSPGTFFATALTAGQLPATIRAGARVVAEVPKVETVC